MIGTAYGQSAKSRYSVATLADLEDRIPQTPNETIEVRNGSSTNLWAAPRLFVLTNSIEAADRVYVVTNRTASTRYIATDRSTGIIDPRHFGATPDDLYDDSTALQAAIDAAGTRSSVYLPKGRFLLASPLAYKDQLHVKGEGDGTMLAVSTPNGIAFWNATPGTRLYEVFLENFAINTAIGARGSAAITLTNVSYARLEKITVHAYDGKGFQYGVKTWGDSPASVGGAWSSSMVGCRIYVYAWPGQPAYAFYGSGGPEWGHGPNSWRIYDNYLNCQPDWVFGGGGTNNGTAILFAQNQNGIQLSKNIFEGWYTNSIILDTGAASTIDGNRFEVSYGIGGTNFAAIRLVNMTNVFIGANMSQGLGDMTKYIRSVNSSYTLFDAASGSPNTIDGDVIVGKTWDVDNVGYLPTVDRFLLMDSTLPTTSLGMGLRTIDGTNNPRSIMVLHAFPGTNISGVNTSWAGIFHGSTLGTVPFYFHASQTNLAITGAGTAVLGLPISSAEFTTYGDIVAGPAPSLWVGSIPSGPVLSITGDGTNQTPNFVVGIQEPPGYPVTNNLRMSGGARGPSNRTYIQSTSSSISPPLDVMIGGTTGAVFTASGASIMGHPVGSAELTVVGDLVAGPNPRMPFALSPADRDIAIYSDSVLDSLGLTAGVFDGVNNPRFSFTYLGPSVRSQINSSGALTNPPIDFMVGSTTGAVLTASGLSVLGHRVSGAALTVFGDIYAGPQPNAWAGSKAGSGNLTITATDTNAMPSIVLGHQGGANSRVELVTSNLLARLVATSSAGAIPLEVWGGNQEIATFDATTGFSIFPGLPFSVGADTITDITGYGLTVVTGALTANVAGLTWVNVRKHGATGDGVTDDTAAFDSALTEAIQWRGESGGGTVYIPAGDYRVNWNMTTPYANEESITIMGDGPGATALRPWTNTSPVLKLLGRNITLEKLMIKGDILNPQGVGLQLGDTNLATGAVVAANFRDLYILDFTTGLYIEGIDQAHFDGMVIQRCTNGLLASPRWFATSGTNAVMSKVKFTRSVWLGNYGDAITLRGGYCEQIDFDTCVIEQNYGKAVVIQQYNPIAGNPFRGFQFRNCFFEFNNYAAPAGNYYDIEFQPALGTGLNAIYSSIIEGCWFQTTRSSHTPIHILNGGDYRIQNNDFISANTYYLSVTNSPVIDLDVAFAKVLVTNGSPQINWVNANRVELKGLTNATPSLILTNTGRLMFSDGVNAPDLNVYRSAARVLAAEGTFRSIGTAASDQALLASVSGDAQGRFTALNSGRFEWGDGAGARSIFMERAGSGVMEMKGASWTFNRANATDMTLQTYVTGDSQYRLSLRADGRMEWTDGVNPAGISLAPASGNILNLLATYRVQRTNTADSAFLSGVIGESASRFETDAAGRLSWGDGTGPRTHGSIERTTLGELTLKTNLVITPGGGITVNGEKVADFSGTNLIVVGDKLNVYGLSSEGHTHDASNTVSGQFATARIPSLPASQITSGNFAAERLGTGTPSSSTFLRGDGTWAEPSMSGYLPLGASTNNPLGGDLVIKAGDVPSLFFGDSDSGTGGAISFVEGNWFIGSAAYGAPDYGIDPWLLIDSAGEVNIPNGLQVGGGAFVEGKLSTAKLVLATAVETNAPAAGEVRFFLRQNGSGKGELCVRFPTGATQILATEP